MSESLVADYKIDPNGLPNILNGSQKSCNLCKAIKPADSSRGGGILLNRRGKKYDSSVISTTFSTDKETKSAHNQLIKLTPTPRYKISTPASRHNHMTLTYSTLGDNRLNYRRKYDPEIFGRNQLDRLILPPLQL
ncbi:uncharacterized protein LOC129788819 [Lutzomyia longipalpis]|uniref:Uncharacterized protein n=1 Tax=Lutzomyia longipalpis TaxID=7200 RepID=A0A1B0CSC5_LUTLO|nr:uncharacterized protein LOC129788819 [Lutzomyia longipalpis]XP_055681141.1 uncharacterized protein LOC129788819 [Lutzomyia longipalpis]XP_055681142.1 uncharacterized protein LOC129788819 [Lutzomyia longipalpis]XP_055681143.1 uncharacterized protein LOC129788819 [Lutzomyia longipalpis]XP_055681144.1 uncharacterized protein LOC129788819 [Lutzomyia longipalpis]XP_055681145.1 uncharacterized protein LOC129788819 [Lutzomyia longipalpis]XP_055681146.1 uncharacterized protein LOC129788819 [Lutzom